MQADRDAWERDGSSIFHCDMTGPECLAAHRELGAREERAQIVAAVRQAINFGYAVPEQKTDQCEHGRFGWEDCIACYDDALEQILLSIERGDHLTNIALAELAARGLHITPIKE